MVNTKYKPLLLVHPLKSQIVKYRLRGHLWDQLGVWVRSQIGYKLGNQLVDKLVDQLRDQLGDLLRKKIW